MIKHIIEKFLGKRIEEKVPDSVKCLSTFDWITFDSEIIRGDGISRKSENCLGAEGLLASWTIQQMISKSFWIEPASFFETFGVWDDPFPDDDIIVELYKELILLRGWQGSPLTTFRYIYRVENSPVSAILIESGRAKYLAASKLFEAGELPNGYKIPVFHLDCMYNIVEPKYRKILKSAFIKSKGANINEHFNARELIAANRFLSLCTGIGYP